MFLLIKNLYDSLYDRVIVVVSDVLDSFDGGNDYTDQGGDGMAQWFILYAEDMQQEFEVLLMADFEDVSSY